MTDSPGLDCPGDLRYTRDHEWARVEGAEATMGITAYAQGELGDIVFVDLPKIGVKLAQFAKLGEIESVKTVSDIFLPLGGEIIAVNTRLKQEPELVNRDPYGEGWMVKLRLDDEGQAAKLLPASDYQRLLANAH